MDDQRERKEEEKEKERPVLEDALKDAYEVGEPEPFFTNEYCPYAPQNGVHLYHFFPSFYSRLARQMLHLKNIQFEGHHIHLALHQQYSANYVKMNPRCVVPTLVIDGRVTTDAENILRFVENTFHPGSLTPLEKREREEMERMLGEAKRINVEALTFGSVEQSRGMGMKGYHESKLDKLSFLMEECEKEDPELFLFYKRKREIMERTVGVFNDGEKVARILEVAVDAFDQLREKLLDGPNKYGGYLVSPHYSLADLYWTHILLRFKERGFDKIVFKNDTTILKYREKLFKHSSFVVDQGSQSMFGSVFAPYFLDRFLKVSFGGLLVVVKCSLLFANSYSSPSSSS